MQGAWLLCSHLAAHRDALLRGRDQTALARRYAHDWRAAFAARVRWASLFAAVAMRPGAVRVLRPILRRRPSLLALAAVLGGKVRRPRLLAPRSLPAIPPVLETRTRP